MYLPYHKGAQVKMFSFKDVKYRDILDIGELAIVGGCVTGIVGESGSGKTTLIRLMNKMISPSSGVIQYKGTDLSDIDSVSHRQSVVMLGQGAHMFSGTIRDNLLYGIKLRSMSPRLDVKPSKKARFKLMADSLVHHEHASYPSDAELREILDSFRIGARLDESTINLSGGEKQRISLIRVILMKPEFMLLDEPTSALDPATEDILIDHLRRIPSSTGAGMVVVSHSKNLADRLCDTVVRIERGRLANG
jgi:putative ABC transport system ATP-binding protein